MFPRIHAVISAIVGEGRVQSSGFFPVRLYLDFYSMHRYSLYTLKKVDFGPSIFFGFLVQSSKFLKSYTKMSQAFYDVDKK